MAASQIKKPAGYRLVKTCFLKQAWVRFVAKQENLQGTGRLHSLVHIFVQRSDAQAMFEDYILWYGMQTDGLICVLNAKKPEVLWRLAKL